MKTLPIVALICLFSVKAISGQNPGKEEVLIKNFLTYVSGPKWHIDSVVDHYVLFYNEESKVASKVTRKFYLSMAVAELAEKLKAIKLSELTVTPYNDVEDKLQIMNLGEDYRQRSFVVSDPSRKFVRYFLIKDNQIESFVLFQDKAYLLLN